jgi:hypothetical protein
MLGSAMNIFTTEHPLDCQSQGETPGLRSPLLRMLLLALILSPFLAVGIWFLDVSDNHDSTPDFPPSPVWVDLLGAALFSLIIAFVVTGLATVFARLTCRASKPAV